MPEEVGAHSPEPPAFGAVFDIPDGLFARLNASRDLSLHIKRSGKGWTVIGESDGGVRLSKPIGGIPVVQDVSMNVIGELQAYRATQRGKKAGTKKKIRFQNLDEPIAGTDGRFFLRGYDAVSTPPRYYVEGPGKVRQWVSKNVIDTFYTDRKKGLALLQEAFGSNGSGASKLDQTIKRATLGMMGLGALMQKTAEGQDGTKKPTTNASKQNETPTKQDEPPKGDERPEDEERKSSDETLRQETNEDDESEDAAPHWSQYGATPLPIIPPSTPVRQSPNVQTPPQSPLTSIPTSVRLPSGTVDGRSTPLSIDEKGFPEQQTPTKPVTPLRSSPPRTPRPRSRPQQPRSTTPPETPKLTPEPPNDSTSTEERQIRSLRDLLRAQQQTRTPSSVSIEGSISIPRFTSIPPESAAQGLLLRTLTPSLHPHRIPQNQGTVAQERPGTPISLDQTPSTPHQPEEPGNAQPVRQRVTQPPPDEDDQPSPITPSMTPDAPIPLTPRRSAPPRARPSRRSISPPRQQGSANNQEPVPEPVQAEELTIPPEVEDIEIQTTPIAPATQEAGVSPQRVRTGAPIIPPRASNLRAFEAQTKSRQNPVLRSALAGLLAFSSAQQGDIASSRRGESNARSTILSREPGEASSVPLQQFGAPWESKTHQDSGPKEGLTEQIRDTREKTEEAVRQQEMFLGSSEPTSEEPGSETEPEQSVGEEGSQSPNTPGSTEQPSKDEQEANRLRQLQSDKARARQAAALQAASEKGLRDKTMLSKIRKPSKHRNGFGSLSTYKLGYDILEGSVDWSFGWAQFLLEANTAIVNDKYFHFKALPSIELPSMEGASEKKVEEIRRKATIGIFLVDLVIAVVFFISLALLVTIIYIAAAPVWTVITTAVSAGT